MFDLKGSKYSRKEIENHYSSKYIESFKRNTEQFAVVESLKSDKDRHSGSELLYMFL